MQTGQMAAATIIRGAKQVSAPFSNQLFKQSTFPYKNVKTETQSSRNGVWSCKSTEIAASILVASFASIIKAIVELIVAHLQGEE